MILFTVLISFLIIEAGLRLSGVSPVRSTWLQLHERGYFMNQKGGYAIHSLKNKKFKYDFTEFRTRGQIPEHPHKRIFVYGDSFTFGLFLDEEDTFIYHLNKRLQSRKKIIQLYNAGVGGTGLGDWVAQLETDLENEIPIDGIMFVLNYNDFGRALFRNQFVLKDGKLLASKRWEERAIKKILDNSSAYKFLQEHLHIVSGMQRFFWTYYFEDMTDGFNPYTSKVLIPEADQFELESNYIIQLTDALFGRLKSLAEKYEKPIWVTTTGFITDERVKHYDARVFPSIDSILTRHEIPYYDITPLLSESIDGQYSTIEIPGDGHPNEEGNRLMAQFMEAFILEQLTTHFE